MSIDAWGKPTPDHMKPLDLTEDRTPEQLAADGDAPGAEPVPCGRIASATHCCEYHAIHSDDDFATALALLDLFTSADSQWPIGELKDEARAFVLAHQPGALTGCTSPGGPGDCYDIDCPSPVCNPPAATAIGERCANCDQRLDAEADRDTYHAALLEKLARTEAEQAVLDAMGGFTEDDLRDSIAATIGDDCREAKLALALCSAELARRRLKP